MLRELAGDHCTVSYLAAVKPNALEAPQHDLLQKSYNALVTLPHNGKAAHLLQNDYVDHGGVVCHKHNVALVARLGRRDVSAVSNHGAPGQSKHSGHECDERALNPSARRAFPHEDLHKEHGAAKHDPAHQ